MARRASRVAAVEILYGSDVREVPVDELLTDRDDCDEYCMHLVAEVRTRQGQIDALLNAHARGWTTERMSPVDRNVLRVAALELLEADVPVGVAIDEAIELAKRFSGEDAGRFVNGVLEAVRQAIGVAGGNGGGSSSG